MNQYRVKVSDKASRKLRLIYDYDEVIVIDILYSQSDIEKHLSIE